MGKRTKRVQEILKKNPDTKNCTDLRLLLNEHHAIEGKSYHGTLTYDNEDHSTFVEDDPKRKPAASKEPNTRPDLQWHALAGSLHGKVSVNTNGAMLMLYLRHEEYNTDGRQLADILVSEAEQIGEVLSEIDITEEVAQCGK